MGFDEGQAPILHRVLSSGIDKCRKTPQQSHDDECRDEEMVFEHGTVEYKLYKRRFIGLASLILLNIVGSWDWLTYAALSDTSAQYFKTSEANVNWLSTSFLFAFAFVTPGVVWCMDRWGPKTAIVTSAVLMIVGNWIRYAGAQVNIFGVVMFGQIVIGFSQPFFLSIPTKYSDMWFSTRGRTSATAIVSLANPLGGALGELIDPSLASKPHQVPTMTLYVAIIASAMSAPAFFIPARPPTPPNAVVASEKTPLHQSLKKLAKSPEFLVIWTAFSVYVGLFNAFSSVINQVLKPHGFSEDESGIAGAILIFVGLGAAAIISPLTDYHKHYLLTVKILVPIIAASYIGMVWAPNSNTVAPAYVVCGIIGASSFATLPVILEYLVEITYPIPPEVSSTLCWMGGQVFGAIFIIIDDALKASVDARVSENMTHSLIFQAVIAGASVPMVLVLGMFGRGEALKVRRSDAEKQLKMSPKDVEASLQSTI